MREKLAKLALELGLKFVGGATALCLFGLVALASPMAFASGGSSRSLVSRDALAPLASAPAARSNWIDPVPESIVDFQALNELVRAKANASRIADAIASGPLSREIPVVTRRVVFADERRTLAQDRRLSRAFFEIPLALLSELGSELSDHACRALDRVVLWGLYAGFQMNLRSFTAQDNPLDESTRLDWARLVITLNQGLLHRELGPDCDRAHRSMRLLWRSSLRFEHQGSTRAVGGATVERFLVHVGDSPTKVTLSLSPGSKRVRLAR